MPAVPAPPSAVSSRYMALPPKMQSQKKARVVGTNITPTMNSRMVRPRLIRAMNIPTKGAQEIHQPQ